MRRLFFQVAVLPVALLVSSCGGGGGSSPTSPSSSTPAPSSSAITITIMRQNGAQSFSPNPASAGGKTVVFRNADSIVHRVVLNDASIDTGDLAPGATSRTFTMPASGTNYHCSVHPDMVGAVSGTSGEPPACDGPYCDGTAYY